MNNYICDKDGNVVIEFKVCDDCLDKIIYTINKMERQCNCECEIDESV